MSSDFATMIADTSGELTNLVTYNDSVTQDTIKGTQQVAVLNDGKAESNIGDADRVNEGDGVIVNLGEVKDIQEIYLEFEGAAATVYDVSLSADGVKYTTVAFYNKDNGEGARVDKIVLENPQSAQYIKIAYYKATNSGWGINLRELSAFGGENTNQGITPSEIDYPDDALILLERNIALNAEVTVSSTSTVDGTVPSNITDGKLSTYWRSYGSADGEDPNGYNTNYSDNDYIILALKEAVKVSDIENVMIMWNTKNVFPSTMKIEVSETGEDDTYTTVYNNAALLWEGPEDGNAPITAMSQYKLDSVTNNVQYVKFSFTGAKPWGYQIKEIAILADKNAEEIPEEGQLNVEDYKNSDDSSTWTVPTESGKVFAGWYSDKECTTSYTGTTGYAYAKFVDANVLTAWAQIKEGEETNEIRFLSSVDGLDYEKVGFSISGTYGDKNLKATNTETKTVYTYITAEEAQVYPNAITKSNDSKFIFTHVIKGLDKETKLTVTVTPYWVTADGTKVNGAPKTFEAQGGNVVTVPEAQ